jgi:hypothetical protein
MDVRNTERGAKYAQDQPQGHRRHEDSPPLSEHVHAVSAMAPAVDTPFNARSLYSFDAIGHERDSRPQSADRLSP